MVDDEDNIGAWVRGLRGRLGSGALAGLGPIDIGDSNGGTPVDW